MRKLIEITKKDIKEIYKYESIENIRDVCIGDIIAYTGNSRNDYYGDLCVVLGIDEDNNYIYAFKYNKNVLPMPRVYKCCICSSIEEFSYVKNWKTDIKCKKKNDEIRLVKD